MLGTIGIIATGTLMMFNPSGIENMNTGSDMDHYTATELVLDSEEDNQIVSFAITVDATDERLEEIKLAAEEAGMGFTYKVRGVSKKKLVIDMVIENGEDFTMDRITVTEADGVKYIQWEVDADGQALVFMDDSTEPPLTQNR
jgi:hypothetical protein